MDLAGSNKREAVDYCVAVNDVRMAVQPGLNSINFTCGSEWQLMANYTSRTQLGPMDLEDRVEGLLQTQV